MEKQNDILEELKSWNSPLAGLSRSMPYVVPEGYFGMLYKQLQESLLVSSVTEHNIKAGKEMPFAVPSNYFNTLPDAILTAAKQTEILPKTNPFSAPEGYFDQLPMQLLDTVKQTDKKAKTKVISLTPVWKNIRWAAAAILVMGISFGAYKMSTPTNISTEKQIARLPQSAINDYVDQNIDAFDMANIEQSIAANYEQVSFEQLHEDEIVNYLDETGWNENTIN